MKKNEIMEAAANAAGPGPHWTHKPAKVVLTLANGQEFVYPDVALIGVARLLESLGAP